jgi:acetyl-CoA synthetase
VLDKVARELRDHVGECLGGLARPRAVAFLDAVPDEMSREALRGALTVLCSARPEGQFRVSRAQVRAALAASGRDTG